MNLLCGFIFHAEHLSINQHSFLGFLSNIFFHVRYGVQFIRPLEEPEALLSFAFLDCS